MGLSSTAAKSLKFPLHACYELRGFARMTKERSTNHGAGAWREA